MASSRATVICLGCGENISKRDCDRKALQGTSEANAVVSAWRELLELMVIENYIEKEEDRLCTDTYLTEDVSQEKMCRKCFPNLDATKNSKLF